MKAPPDAFGAASWPLALGGVAIVSAFSLGSLGCTPTIGDRCSVSSDCSIQGNRTCDTSQPNGYCTILSCTANSCPDNAACVQFGASVPGCPYDDYGAPSRTGTAMCLKTCGTDSDCRQSDGYVCTLLSGPPWPGGPPWTAVLDNRASTRVCVVAASSASAPIGDAAICSAALSMAPSLDAMVTLVDAPADVGDVAEPSDVTDAGALSDATEGGAPSDAIDVTASPDVSDVGVLESETSSDAGSDVGSDAAQDATLDSGVLDSGVFDAPSGA